MQQNDKGLASGLYFRMQSALRENYIGFISALVFGFAAHMFAFANKLVNADEIESLFGKGATVTSGRWGLELVKPIFPDASMPWLYGTLSLLMLAVSVCLIIRLFYIKSPLMQILLAGMITAFPSQTSVFCFMFTSTAYALAFFLSVLCVRLFVKGGLMQRAGAVLALLLSLGIYQAYVALTAALFVLVVIMRCIDDEHSGAENIFFALRALGMMLISLALYIGVTALVFRFTGAEFNNYVKDNVNEAGLLGRIRMAYDFLYYTLSYREFALVSGEASRYLHILLLAFSFVLCAVKSLAILKKGKLVNSALLMLCVLILPLAVYCMFLVMDKGSIHTIVLHSFVAFHILAALLADRLLCGTSLIHRGGRDLIYLVLTVALAGNIYLANMCYLKLYLQYENAYSFYSVLLSRAQSAEGYEEGCELAIIGHQDNQLTTFPEIDIGYLMGPSQNLVNIYSRENFLRRYMGTEIPLADSDELDMLRQTPEFEEMPEYPYYGSVKKIDDYIVVKLG